MSNTIPSSLTDGLNAEQLRAVTTESPNTLVLAGAGSGKTKVLTTRIAWLLEQMKATQESILAVTFTNKAAKEMKTRIANILGKNPSRLWVGTFHGLCNQMLREFAAPIGIPDNFHIIDTDDQKSICKRLLKELKIEDYNANDVANHINGIKEGNREIGADKILDDLFYKYTAICEREGAMDFADLMHKTNIALSQNAGGMREHYNARFSHILVDEFQDTNPEQYKWLKLLKSKTAEIFVVGDDDQSIYSFRGATPDNMSSFIRGARSEDIIKLEQNYRSTSNILHAANSVIDHNTGRLGKTLRSEKGMGSMIDVCKFDDNWSEADYIAARAKSLIDAGMQPQDIALLYRSNHQSASLEKSLLKSRVPYIIHGGTRFFERQEIKDAIAYLRLALNSYDDTAFYRIVNFPARGLGKKVIETLELGVTASEYETSMMEVAIASQNIAPKLKPFVDIISELDDKMNDLSLPESIILMYERSGLMEHYKKDPEGESRVNHLQELVSLAKIYDLHEARADANTKERLMEFMATFTLEDTKEQEAGYGKKAVTLMTVHAAKGLEFDHVFLTGAEDGTMPHANSIKSGNESAIEEERRLMYVAITRARKNLVITMAKQRMVFGDYIKYEESRFIEELPERVIRYQEIKSDNKNQFNRKPNRMFGTKKQVKENKSIVDIMKNDSTNPVYPSETLKKARFRI